MNNKQQELPIQRRRCGSMLALLTIIIATATLGCSRGPEIVPVQGKVLYNGEPLQFGGVMFQPEAGQPARAEIQPDGTFELSTNSRGDGATVGTNRVRITCYEAQNPATAASDGERPLGALLIPQKYTDIDTSEIVVEVKRGGDEVVIALSDA